MNKQLLITALSIIGLFSLSQNTQGMLEYKIVSTDLPSMYISETGLILVPDISSKKTFEICRKKNCKLVEISKITDDQPTLSDIIYFVLKNRYIKDIKDRRPGYVGYIKSSRKMDSKGNTMVTAVFIKLE